MRRRDFNKGLLIAGGSLLLPSTAIAAARNEREKLEEFVREHFHPINLTETSEVPVKILMHHNDFESYFGDIAETLTGPVLKPGDLKPKSAKLNSHGALAFSLPHLGETGGLSPKQGCAVFYYLFSEKVGEMVNTYPPFWCHSLVAGYGSESVFYLKLNEIDAEYSAQSSLGTFKKSLALWH